MVHVAKAKFAVEGQSSIVAYPSFGYLSRDRRFWKIRIQGAVYAPLFDGFRDRLLVRLLQRALKSEGDIIESDVFRRRVARFLATHQGGKRIFIRVGRKIYRLRRRTQANGHFRGILRLRLPEVARLANDGHIENGWLNYEVLGNDDDSRCFVGHSMLIGPTGLSVISDIDDTIKHTGVPNRGELLANTFLREFASVPGMSNLYRQWANHGAAFHYVSSSPWQLFEPLEELCRDNSFPWGTYHLRTLRVKDPRVLSLLMPTRWGKHRMIRSILKAFPQRRFILVGDSGEKDPELYGAAARRYPNRVVRIYIRDLDLRMMHANRLRKAFRGSRPHIWRVFDEAVDLTEDWQSLV